MRTIFHKFPANSGSLEGQSRRIFGSPISKTQNYFSKDTLIRQLPLLLGQLSYLPPVGIHTEPCVLGRAFLLPTKPIQSFRPFPNAFVALLVLAVSPVRSSRCYDLVHFNQSRFFVFNPSRSVAWFFSGPFCSFLFRFILFRSTARRSLIKVDQADVRAVLKDAGDAVLAIGEGGARTRAHCGRPRARFPAAEPGGKGRADGCNL